MHSSEPEAGSDAASMRSRAVRDGDGWILNGNKRWITNAGISKYYTVMASTDPDKGPKGISAFVVHADDPGFSLGAPERKLGIKGSPTRELYFDNVKLPADRMIGAEGTGWNTAMKALDVTRVGIGAQAVGLAQGSAGCCGCVRQGAVAVRQNHCGLQRDSIHARGHGDRGRGSSPIGLPGSGSQRTRGSIRDVLRALLPSASRQMLRCESRLMQSRSLVVTAT